MESSLLLAVAAAYCTACVLGRTCYTDVGHSCWCDFASKLWLDPGQLGIIYIATLVCPCTGLLICTVHALTFYPNLICEKEIIINNTVLIARIIFLRQLGNRNANK